MAAAGGSVHGAAVAESLAARAQLEDDRRRRNGAASSRAFAPYAAPRGCEAGSAEESALRSSEAGLLVGRCLAAPRPRAAEWPVGLRDRPSAPAAAEFGACTRPACSYGA